MDDLNKETCEECEYVCMCVCMAVFNINKNHSGNRVCKYWSPMWGHGQSERRKLNMNVSVCFFLFWKKNTTQAIECINIGVLWGNIAQIWTKRAVRNMNVCICVCV